MLEVEVKYAVRGFENLLQVLREQGVTAFQEHEERDLYLRAPDRDFARTDEALRIRSVGNEHRITYKGPKRDALTKTRFELEIPLPSGSEGFESFRLLFDRLGYQPVMEVRKRRRSATWHRGEWEIQISLDEVEHVGRFVELEVQAEEERFESARATVLESAHALGLRDLERRSYLQMLLEHQAAQKGVER